MVIEKKRMGWPCRIEERNGAYKPKKSASECHRAFFTRSQLGRVKVEICEVQTIYIDMFLKETEGAEGENSPRISPRFVPVSKYEGREPSS